MTTDINPGVPGHHVYPIDNPGRRGVITVRIKQAGSITLVDVECRPGDKSFKRLDLIACVVEERDALELIDPGDFGTPSDLRRLLTFERPRLA